MTTQLPQDFRTTHCGNGITIRKPGERYEVEVNGQWVGSTETYMDAIDLVEVARSGLKS